MQHETWKISEVRGDEKTGVVTGASREEALRAIRIAMYGEADVLGGTGADPVHELPLAA
ncbi:MAG TPA: hypothetical protein VGH14_18735 [Solirubrobacterales bacterium]|jgi:hypothetical protein